MRGGKNTDHSRAATTVATPQAISKRDVMKLLATGGPHRLPREREGDRSTNGGHDLGCAASPHAAHRQRRNFTPHTLTLNAREHPRSLHAGVFSAAFTHGNVAAMHRRVSAELATRRPAVFDEAGCLRVAANATYVVCVVSFPAARAATSTLSSEVTTRSAPAAASAT